MKARYRQFNPKRRFASPAATTARQEQLASWAQRAGYGGNPEHKKNPGDFALEPPCEPRQGKSLCDLARIFKRKQALQLLKAGLTVGLVSDREKEGWPKQVWAVTDEGVPLEAQLENPAVGTYHGYPMPQTDPMAQEVMRRWRHRHG